MEQTIDIQSLLAAFKRRWWLMLLPVALLTPLAAGIAYILPPVYTATARILVVSPQIPESLASSTVLVSVGERIAVIEQRLMTRQNALDIAAKFDVTATRGAMSPSEIVDLMRASTEIRGTRLGGATGVLISFTSDRADLSARVANEYLSLVLEQNLQQRADRAVGTSSYFRQEAERLQSELSALEAAITRYKIENGAALPDSLGFRREELSRLQAQSFDREVRLAEIQNEKQKIIEAYRLGEFDAFGRRQTPEEAELERLRTALLQRRTVYSSSHPIVQGLETQIAALSSRLDVGEDGTPPEGIETQVTRILEAIDEQVAKLERQASLDASRIESLEESIERTPSVELELSRMERALGVAQTQYREVVLKLAQAETGERLEVNQQSERFEVIERAETPPSPTAPNRPLIVAAGFAGSLGLGFGFALLAELLNRSLRTASDVERQLGMRPIVSIPYIATDRELWRRKWLWRFAALTVVVVIPAALFLIDRHYQPLPLLAQRVMDAAGVNYVLTLIENRFGR